ncbi:MAG: 23S rRNA (guanosine(2251)-2'-O)-methyltransferase RlmB [Bacilli bacterium]|jgi:23S rRNA (guanosine2251-2'-O)-methyltransferase|nr:23S rRNA (guanosine(2251)-2'-O)-methyltransferase RlmB [Bacilli bacterium]
MDDNVVFGKIPVKNVLIGNRKPIRVFLNQNHPDTEILDLARKKSVLVKLVDSRVLDQLSEHMNHQGVVCSLPSFAYTDLDQLIASLADKKDATLVVLDGIEDPVNFGSIIRSSCAFAVDGILIGKNRQVPVNGTVSKIATGGEEIIPISQVTNISQSLEKLKKAGFWIVASAGEGTDVYDKVNYNGKIALVIGSEGFGVSRLVREHSDFVASIPLPGALAALNASIACAVFLAQIGSYRRNSKK